MSSKSGISSKQLIVMIVVGIFSIAMGIWMSQKIQLADNDHSIPSGLDATVLPNARILNDFSLSEDNNQKFNLAALKGHWSFLFFGYTNCPDVCPITLKVMQQVWKTLPTKINEKGHPRLYFVSVDPDRDSLEKLKKYVDFFNPEFTGVTGKLDEIDKLTKQIGILYGYEDKDSDNNYTVNHSAQLILFDPQARMRAVFSPPHEAKTIAANFQTIRLFYGD